MTCREVEGWIIAYADGAPVPPEVAAHIAGCEDCRSLARAIGKTLPPSAVPPEELQRIAEATLADLKPVRLLASPGTLIVELLCALLIVAAAGAAALGIGGLRALSPVQMIAVFSVLLSGAVLLAYSLSRQVAPGSRLVVSPGLSVAGVLGVILLLVAALFRPHQEATFVATGLVCLRIGLGVAVASALLFWLVLRRGAALNPVLTGATAGAMAGLSGLCDLEIFCPNLNAYHILAWHLGALLTSTAIGTAAGVVAGHFSRRDA